MDKELHDSILRKLADNHRLIEAGFFALRMMALPRDAPKVQIDAMRDAFFAGAQHVFASIIGILEPGEEPTENDLKRLTWISEELEEFVKDIKARKPRPN